MWSLRCGSRRCDCILPVFFRRWGHTGIQMLSPVPISTIEHTEGLDANISVLRCLRWQKFELSRRTSIREKFRQVNRSASNCLTSRSSKKKKKDRRRGKWDIRVRFPSSDEESNKPFLDDETRCDDGHSIFGTRDSLSPRKIFPALEEVFASTVQLCSVDFS